jgi:hypothetical protein
MRLSISGVLTDHLNRILLLTQPDSGLLLPPSISLRPGYLPEALLAGFVREQTGLIILPVRLTGLSFGRRREADRLTFVYRCLMRGGTLAEEARPTSGFFDAQPLPGPMLARDRRMVDRALHHAGGPAAWDTEPRDIVSVARTWLAGGGLEPAGEVWTAEVRVVLRDAQGQVLTRPADQTPAGQLAGTVRPQEAPWQAAARLLAPFGVRSAAGLPEVIIDRESPRIAFLFSAVAPAGATIPAGYSFNAPAASPEDPALTVFRLSDGPLAA